MTPSAATAAAAVEDSDTSSRLSVSSNLEPRSLRSPSASFDRASLQSSDVRDLFLENVYSRPITRVQAHFSLQSTATAASEASLSAAAAPAPRKTKLQHIFEEIFSTEGTPVIALSTHVIDTVSCY